MPAKDHYHDTVKRALIKEKWLIRREHYPIRVGLKRVWIDLSAEKEDISAAVFVEVKDFENSFSVEALRDCIGQYVLYRAALKYAHLEEIPLFLAVPHAAYEGIFAIPLGRVALQEIAMNLVVFNQIDEVIEQWLPYTK